MDNNDGTSSCKVKASTFGFNYEDINGKTLREIYDSEICEWTFGDSLYNLCAPFALTHWTDEAVAIALPPLTCDPKIIKLILPRLSPTNRTGEVDVSTERCKNESSFLTLCTPIYFPTSTPRRNPCLMMPTLTRPSQNYDEYIYLVLDKSVPLEDKNISLSVDQSNLPVVLCWKIAKESAWRDWDKESDGKSEDVKKQTLTAQKLRGNFIESNKLFNVAVRGGADWKRVGILSCM